MDSRTTYPGRDLPAPAPAGGGARIANDGERAAGPGPHVLAASTLAGNTVVNRRDEDLGKLEHIVIDVPSGRIAYGVLARGGVFGVGEKLFAIPWYAFTLDARRQCFVLDVDADRLAKAPGFDRAHWPAMGDATWAAQVHDYFGVREPGSADIAS